MTISNEEKQVQSDIRIRNLIGAFIAHCKQTRPSFAADTWRRAFRETENDTELLRWTRQQAALFIQSQVTTNTTLPAVQAA